MIEDGLHLNEQGAKALIDYVRTRTYETEDRRPALTLSLIHISPNGRCWPSRTSSSFFLPWYTLSASVRTSSYSDSRKNLTVP